MFESLYYIPPEGLRSPFSKNKKMLLELLQTGAISREIFKYMTIVSKMANEENILVCKQAHLCDELGITVNTLKKIQDEAIALNLISVERAAKHQNKITIKL